MIQASFGIYLHGSYSPLIWNDYYRQYVKWSTSYWWQNMSFGLNWIVLSSVIELLKEIGCEAASKINYISVDWFCINVSFYQFSRMSFHAMCRRTEWYFRPLFCTIRLYWTGYTWANEMTFMWTLLQVQDRSLGPLTCSPVCYLLPLCYGWYAVESYIKYTFTY